MDGSAVVVCLGNPAYLDGEWITVVPAEPHPEQLEFQRRHEYAITCGRTFAGATIGIVGLGSIGEAALDGWLGHFVTGDPMRNAVDMQALGFAAGSTS